MYRYFFLKIVLHTILDRKSTRLNSRHASMSYAVFCLKKQTAANRDQIRDDTRAAASGHGGDALAGVLNGRCARGGADSGAGPRAGAGGGGPRIGHGLD